ncbi:MAG: FAD-dependent oxidoreductase, partial [Candidatus Micrarchaeaceae archaeon]
LRNVLTNEVTEMKIDGVFVAIGYDPNTAIFKGQLKTDDQGYIITKDEVKTDIDGVFVAGDVADRFYRQAVTAAGSGAKAALVAREFLLKLKYEQSKAQK